MKINNKTLLNEETLPKFYGTTKIILKKDSIFNLNDTRYRIFAKDFKNFDISNNIISTHNVTTDLPGNYQIDYSVTDSNGNNSKISVPVIVSDNTSVDPMIEKTFYSLPSVANIESMGISRGHNHDKQIIGVFIKAGSSIKVRAISSTDLKYYMYNNDSKKENSKTINGNWQDITFSNDYVPFIKTLFNQTQPVKLEFSWKENDLGIKMLNYYNYGDNQENFFDHWEKSINEYSVIDSESITILVPYEDRKKLINYKPKYFSSLDLFLEYYKKIIDYIDDMIGLSYNPEDPIDQNVKSKFFIKANYNGAGSAYYAGDHIGVNNVSVSSFFQANWGGIHEIGHGYQGDFGKKGINLNEVSNNIYGYFIQKNPNIYPFEDRWLASLDKVEQYYNNIRTDGGNFYTLDLKGKLYFLVNILESFEGEKTFAKIAKFYRRAVKNGQRLNVLDAWAIAIEKNYNFNIEPYLNAWNIFLTEETKNYLNESNSEYGFSAKDLVPSEVDLNELKSKQLIKFNYSLIKNSSLQNISKGVLNTSIDFTSFEKIKSQKGYIKDSNLNTTEFIVSNITNSFELYPGVYKIAFPNIFGEITTEPFYYNILSKQTKNININYENSLIKYRYSNDVKIQLKGYYYPDAAEIMISNAIENEMETLNLNFKYKGTTLYNFAYPASKEYISIKIIDNNNTEIYVKNVYGQSDMLTDLSIETFNIPVKLNYILKIKFAHSSSALNFISTLNNDNRRIYPAPNNIERSYIITNKGLKILETNEDEFYLEVSSRAKIFMNNLRDKLSNDKVSNPFYYSKEKNIFIIEYNKLKEQDKITYLDLYNKIMQI